MDSESYIKEIDDAWESIQSLWPHRAEALVILGSGLGAFAASLSRTTIIKFSDIPHFAQSKVAGHGGRLVLGELSGRKIAVMDGRVHLYEGHAASRVAFPVRVFGLNGTKILLNTNAAGGLNQNLKAGRLVILEDLITLFSENPSIGLCHPKLGEQFWDMSTPFDAKLRQIALELGARNGIELSRGVYCGHRGPAYETIADIKLLRQLGADVVGMSTVPEVLAARQAGMRVLGISLVTNMVSGIAQGPLNHKEVLEAGEKAREHFITLLQGLVAEMF